MSAATRAVSRTGEGLELKLFQTTWCPFCIRVRRAIKDLGVPVALCDISSDAAALRELVEVGGKRQVPCLFVNGAPLYESADIVRFLRDEVVVTTG